MPSFRLNSNTLDFTLSGPGQEGGKAKVMRAKFQPRFWNFKKDVAVKRLKYDESMDEHEFSKVRDKISSAHLPTLTSTGRN